MYFKEFYPNPGLSSYIDSYFVVDTANVFEDITDLIVPDGTFGMLFIDSQKSIRRNMVIEGPPITLKKTSVFGQKTKPVNYFYSQGNASSFGIKINPGGLALFLDHSLKEFKDQFVEIDLLNSAVLSDLENKVLEANTIGNKILLIENFVIERLSLLKSNPDYILFLNLVGYIKEKKGEVRADLLTSHFNSNYKKIERLFHRFLGITPKTYIRIVRLAATIHYFSKNKSENLTQTGYEMGFFDQSHFIREFKAFTSLSPREFFTKKYSDSEETCIKLITNQW